MYILKVENNKYDKLIYWTLDGEHIFKIDRIRIIRQGDNKNDPGSNK